jgi:hypothetical protein
LLVSLTPARPAKSTCALTPCTAAPCTIAHAVLLASHPRSTSIKVSEPVESSYGTATDHGATERSTTQWQDRKYLQTTVSVFHSIPPPFKPPFPTCPFSSRPFPPITPPAPRSAPPQLPRKKGSGKFPISISNSRFGLRRRWTGCGKPALDLVRHLSAAIFWRFFWVFCAVCGGLLRLEALGVGRRAAAVASGSDSCRLEARKSWQVAAGSLGPWVSIFDFVGLDLGFGSGRSRGSEQLPISEGFGFVCAMRPLLYLVRQVEDLKLWY